MQYIDALIMVTLTIPNSAFSGRNIEKKNSQKRTICCEDTIETYLSNLPLTMKNEYPIGFILEEKKYW